MNKCASQIVSGIMLVSDVAGVVTNCVSPSSYGPVDQASDWMSLQSDARADEISRTIDSGRYNPTIDSK